MVALRGKKAKATAASRKAIEKEKAASRQRAAAEALAAQAEADEATAAATATSDATAEMAPEERARKLVAFLTYAGLALQAPAKPESEQEDAAAAAASPVEKLSGEVDRVGVAPFLDAMLVAQCVTSKDRAALPQDIMSRLTSASRKRVCGVIFKADEIAYSCRNCQVDSTCVICKDCFMLGDHSGHDVYFQRTTAGSSCDCGDLHAWKRSGFCSRHPGSEEDKDGTSLKKSSLPKGLGSMAPVVIEAVADFAYQVYLGVDQGFELAEALEAFSRDIPPVLLTELATTNSPTTQTVEAVSTSTTTAPAATEGRRRSRGNRQTVAAADIVVDTAVPLTTTASHPTPQQLAIRLHNDDVHSLGEVIKEIRTALDCGSLQARASVSEADRHGDSAIAKMSLVKCISPVSSLVRASINVSVAPVWWEKQMNRIPAILEWLRTIGMASDGLYDIVSEALRKKRTRRLGAPSFISSFFSKGTSSSSLWKDGRVRLHLTAQSLIDELAMGEDGDVHLWASALEEEFDRMYRFSENDDVVSALPLQERCDNVLILDLMKSVSLSQAYRRHKSIREGCKVLSERFFSGNDRAPASLLDVMVRWDCALRKRVAHLGHALLREHMLNKVFRKCMLESYATSYCAMTDSYLRGLGTSPESIFDFAVQFLTVPQLVKDYTRSEVEKDPSKPHLAYELLAATENVLNTAVQKSSDNLEGGVVLNVDHPALSSQKYKHCIDDLEYVFNVGAMPNELVCDDRNLALWISCLKVLQNGDLQARRGIRESHVEYESDSWLSMFNLGIRIHSIFPVAWKGMTPEALAYPKRTVRHISRQVIETVINSSVEFNQKIGTKKLVPIKTLTAAVDDSEFEVYDFNVSAAKTSLHVPLHRFLSSSIRHVAIHESWLRDVLDADGLLSAFALDELPMEKKIELVELPLRCLVMASQIQSNLWRRNGEENMMAQLYNYSALPYCVHYRDADVFLLQVGILLLGPDTTLSLMIDRFQLGDFFMAKELGYTVQEEGVDEQQELQMVEEFLRLIIVLGTSLPSAVGEEYENQFMEEEMLQHLCAKPASFSKLFDIAMLPTGQDDVSVPRLEEVLTRVADFSPPSGLDPGRYELKDGLLEAYNPYFLHLNRETHELARDRWTNYRKAQRQKHLATSSTPMTVAPLKRMRRPLQFLKEARDLLTCRGTLTMVHIILWKIAQDMKSNTGAGTGSSVSDAVISTTLHLLVYGVYAAEEVQEESGDTRVSIPFWTSLRSNVDKFGGSSVLSLLLSVAGDSKLTSSLLDDDQRTTLEWLLLKIRECSTDCASAMDAMKQSKNAADRAVNLNPGTSSDANDGSSSQAVTLEQRKDEARKRALEAMARQQAAFQAMMAEMGDEDEDEDMEADELSSSRPVDDGSSSTLGKRRASAEGAPTDVDESKRPRLSDEAKEVDANCYKCILCHDTSTQGEMGVAAYVHQSTVLTGSFRPEPEEGLDARGAGVRKQVKTLIEKMDLCSGGPTVSSNSPSPALRALAAQFPEWYMDDGFDEELMLDPPMPHLNAVGNQRQLRHNHGTDGEQNTRNQRRRPPIEAFLMNQDEEDLEMLGGVLDLREDQRLFPLPILGATGASPDRRDRGAQRPPGVDRGIVVARRGVPPLAESDMDEDSDEYDEDDHHIHHHHHNHNHHHHHHNHHHSPRRPRANSRIESVPLHLTPCGLHIRTCQHAVHIQCLERYIRSLHEKAIRGEDFDGVQAIDPDAAMTQFLCPLCKTLCNFLIPTSDPGGKNHQLAITARDASLAIGSTKSWYTLVETQLKAPGWYRAVLGRDGDFGDDDDDAHDVWRDYFEETLWEPHGSLEKGAPYLWSACAFSVASFLSATEDEFLKASGTDDFDPLTAPCPPSVEKEFTSLIAVTKFCRWSFSLLEHSEDAKVIWETAKRCNPINSETKREYRKFTKVLGSIDACLRGTILGLLVTDTFTAFVISSVIADSPATIWNCIPVFSAADLLQRVYTEFFVQTKTDERSLLQDKFSLLDSAVDLDASTMGATGSLSVAEGAVRRTRRSSRLAIQPALKTAPATSQGTTGKPTDVKAQSDKEIIRAMQDTEANKDSEEYAVLTLLLRILESDPEEKLKPLTKSGVVTRLRRIKAYNALLVRRMKLFWRCLDDETRDFAHDPSKLVIPSVTDVASSPKPVFTQIWKWCVDRMNSKSFLGSAKTGDKCEHAEGCGEGYIASMFILRDVPRKPRLIDLPLQYDELYGMMSGRKCTRCEKTPCDPGICLVCGEFLCCGDACCSHPYVNHGPQVGECTRHAAECGGGVGIVLMLDQCRVAVIGGSMAAHFPCPYVDAHGEEDVGLQRGRPLRLDTARYKLLESLWLNHRIFSEVSRLRNMRDPQFTLNLSYL